MLCLSPSVNRHLLMPCLRDFMYKVSQEGKKTNTQSVYLRDFYSGWAAKAWEQSEGNALFQRQWNGNSAKWIPDGRAGQREVAWKAERLWGLQPGSVGGRSDQRSGLETVGNRQRLWVLEQGNDKLKIVGCNRRRAHRGCVTSLTSSRCCVPRLYYRPGWQRPSSQGSFVLVGERALNHHGNKNTG